MPLVIIYDFEGAESLYLWRLMAQVRILATILVFIGLSFGQAEAQHLIGSVRGPDGPLGFASVVEQGSTNGTLTNLEGKFDLLLPAGKHTVLVQSLGYKTEERTVEINGKTTELDVTLELQPIRLPEAQVGNQEDPARAIMRRAIAKAPIERLKVKGYTAQVYIKGGVAITKMPWLLKGRLEKEGVKENTTYFTETVSEVTYRAPNFYKNKALSVRSNMDKMGSVPSPSQYVNTSFYMPRVNKAISPLAPNAFAYYTFIYEGIFEDRGVEVNKIRVKPRLGGEDVFDGYIYIIEGEWCLHSLNLTTRHEGITVRTDQLFTPVQQVWMPATQKYDIKGQVLGFGFEAHYVASLRNYALTINLALLKPIEVIDERKEPAATAALKPAEQSKSDDELARLLTDSTSSKKLTRKALRKATKALMRQQKEEARAIHDGENVVFEDSTLVDSMAYKRDSTYWLANRLVPLTQQEVSSTVLLDSMAVVNRNKQRKDSVKNAIRNGTGATGKPLEDVFNALAFGRQWNLTRADTSKALRGRHRPHRLLFSGLVNNDADYNTVEGYVLASKLRYQYYRPETKERPFRDFTIGPKARYQFARHALLPILESEYRFGKGSLHVEGGRWVSQLNRETGVSPLINSVASLFFERNYMRLYQKDFVRLEAENFFADRVQINSYAEIAERTPLENAVKHAFITWGDRSFAPNVDANAYAGTTTFATNRAALAGFSAVFTPSVRYAVHNGHKTYRPGPEPYFHIKTNVGLPGIAQSTTRFANSALGIEQNLRLGIRGQLIYYLEAGAFWYNNQTYSPDYFHFEGNRTFLIVGDGLKAFRNLPYYYYSTPVRYAQQHVVFIPRRFLLSRIRLFEMLGWKETLGYHGLTTPGQPQYSELTYGIDGILRFIRVEGVGVFKDGRYQQTAVRIGLTLKGFTPKLRRKTNEGDGGERGGSINIHL